MRPDEAVTGKNVRYLRIAQPVLVIVAFAIALLLGLKAKGIALALTPAGTIYMLLLQMIVLPVIVASIVSGVARLVQEPRFLAVLSRVLIIFVLFAAVVGAAGIAAGVIGLPGTVISPTGQAALSKTVAASTANADLSVSLSVAAPPHARTSILNLITRIVPRNVFESLTLSSAIPVVIFSLLFGLAIGLLREKQQDYLIHIAEGTLRAFTKITAWLIYLLPLGIICLLAPLVAKTNGQLLRPMSRFVELFVGASAAIILLNFVVIWIRSGKGPLTVIRALVEPSAYAFATGNSLVAIPYALVALTDRLSFRRASVSFVQPVISVAGSFGNMLFFVFATIFTAQLYGQSMASGDYAILLAASIIAAVGTAGKSGVAAVAMLPLVLSPLGLPIDATVAIFGALSVVIGPLIALVDATTSMAASSAAATRSDAVQVAAAPRRRISIRASLIILLATLITLTGGVMLGLLYTGEKKSIYILANSMIREISARAEQRTLNYVQPAERVNRHMQYLLENGIVNPNDHAELLDVLDEEMRNNPEFAAAYFADTGGNFYMVKRMPDSSLSFRTIVRTSWGVSIRWVHSNPAYRNSFPDSVESLTTGYDPRTRGWYQEAVKAGSLVWTNVYLFASDNMLGISNAVPIRNAEGKLQGVLAVDIGLAELSYFLGTLDVSQTGKAFLVNNRGELVALSTPRGHDLTALFAGNRKGSAPTGGADLVLADSASDPLVRQAYLNYQRSTRNGQFFSFTVGGSTYLSVFTAFPASRYFDWTIGIAVPEASVMGQVNQTNTLVLFAAVLIVLIAVGLGINFSRAITFPMRWLSREMERIRNFDLSGDDRLESRIGEIYRMHEAFGNMKHGLRAFNKYVPSRLVAELLQLGEEPKLGGQNRELTFLFSDIAGFTTISERLAPQVLVDEMADYFNALSNIIMGNRGTVDKYIGDAIMAFWNAPAEVDEHPLLACLSAIAMKRILDARRAANRSNAISIFGSRTRIGIHTGEAIVGNMGSNERLNYTAVGDSVNLASRLEGLNKFYGTDIIVSDATRSRVGDAVVTRLLDRVAVKGRTGGIDIYELVETADGVDDRAAAFARAATDAVELYLNRRFDDALARIERASALRPGDVALGIIGGRCRTYRNNAPAEDWNGVYVHHEK